MAKKVALLLSGCGVFDGAEIHESVFLWLALQEAGCEVVAVAPDMAQTTVVNHLIGENKGETRNVREEAARIARGDVLDLSDAPVDQFDALVVPGGFGVAKNLCDFAFNGDGMVIDASIKDWIGQFIEAKKPVGLACIAPVMAPQLFGEGVECTIGRDPETVAAITAMGGTHVECKVDEVCVDEANRLVTTPAYMLANSLVEVREGTKKLVDALVALCE